MSNLIIDYNFGDDQYIIKAEDPAVLREQHIQSLRQLTPTTYTAPNNYGTIIRLMNADRNGIWTSDAQSGRNAVSLRRNAARGAHTNGFVKADNKYFRFQKRAANMLWEAQHGFINDDTGLGKTRTAIGIGCDVMGPHLVVCPKIAKEVWRNEIARVEPDMSVLVVEGTAAQRRKQLDHDHVVENYDWVIMNYEQLKTHTSYPSWTQKYAGDEEYKELNRFEWGCVFLDEGHRIKNPESIQTRCAWRLGTQAANRYILTATPITVDPGDLWAQCRFIQPDEFNSRSKFRDYYFNWAEGPHGGIDILGWKPGKEQEFATSMNWRTSKNTYEDDLVQAELTDMPEAVEPTILELEMKGVQKDLYKTMVDSMMIDLAAMDKDEFLIAGSKVERWVRLRQIANGVPAIGSEDKVYAMTPPSNKVDAVKDLLDGVNGPVVIYAEHALVIHMLYGELTTKGHACDMIVGEIPTERRAQSIEAFQAGKLDVLLCTMGAASESITLTNASMLIIAQESTSLRHMIQTRGRVRRIGSTAPVPVYVLRSKGTVEIALADGNGEKAGFLDSYLETPDRYRNLLLGKLQ